VIFQAITAVKILAKVSRVVTPFSVVVGYHRIRDGGRMDL